MPDEMSNFLVNSPYGFAAGFLVFLTLWCIVCFMISLLSGWFSLSRRFRKQSAPYGETRSIGLFFSTVKMRYWSNYSGVVRMTAADDALYLSVFFTIRAGHPPLRIPWNEVQFSRVRRFWRRFVVLALGTEERVPFRISERMARKLGIMGRIPETGNSGQVGTVASRADLL